MMSLLGAAHQSAVLVISEIEGPADRPERRVESTPSKDMAGDGKVLSDLAPAISELRHSRRSQPRAPSSFLSNVRVGSKRDPLVDAFMSAFPGSGHQSSIPVRLRPWRRCDHLRHCFVELARYLVALRPVWTSCRAVSARSALPHGRAGALGSLRTLRHMPTTGWIGRGIGMGSKGRNVPRAPNVLMRRRLRQPLSRLPLLLHPDGLCEWAGAAAPVACWDSEVVSSRR
jgi:hypothetical protein